MDEFFDQVGSVLSVPVVVALSFAAFLKRLKFFRQVREKFPDFPVEILGAPLSFWFFLRRKRIDGETTDLEASVWEVELDSNLMMLAVIVIILLL